MNMVPIRCVMASCSDDSTHNQVVFNQYVRHTKPSRVAALGSTGGPVQMSLGLPWQLMLNNSFVAGDQLTLS